MTGGRARLDLGSLDGIARVPRSQRIYFENPNFFGVIEEDAEGAIEKVHGAGGLGVVGWTPYRSRC